MPYLNRSCDLCGMMVAEEVDIMHRRTILSLATTVLILAMAVAVTAQGRGFRDGAIFRAALPGPAVPGPAFIGRPPVPVIAPRIHTAPFGFARSPRTIIVPPVLGYYSPYVWPAPPLFAEPGYSPYIGPVYSEPAYASPAASAPAVSQREIGSRISGRQTFWGDRATPAATKPELITSSSAPDPGRDGSAAHSCCACVS